METIADQDKNRERLNIYNDILMEIEMETQETIDKFGKTHHLTDEGKINVIKRLEQRKFVKEPIIIEKIVEVEKPKKSTPQELEYQKAYYQLQKLRKEQDNKEKEREDKINKAKQRKTLMCYVCHRYISPLNLQVEIITKKHKTKEQINIIGECPVCHNKMIGFGGFLPQN